jgi:hypothetical protein
VLATAQQVAPAVALLVLQRLPAEVQLQPHQLQRVQLLPSQDHSVVAVVHPVVVVAVELELEVEVERRQC